MQLGEFRSQCEDRYTHRYQNPWWELILYLAPQLTYHSAHCYAGAWSVAVLGTTGPGAEIICGALVWKFFVNQDYSSSSFSLKLFCLKGVFKCFPVSYFQFFLRYGALSGLPKVRGLGPWPPGPLKTATGRGGKFYGPGKSTVHFL